MKKLKIILPCKYLYYWILLITIIYTIINITLIEKYSIYDINENNFILKVINIKENSTGKTITFLGKEKLISYVKNDFNYQLGDILEIKGILELPKKNTIPNLFNYQNYLYNQDIFYILNINEITLLKENSNIFYKIKTSIVDLINKYESKDYLHAFILGNTSFIDNDIKDKYLNMGINHLFAISGMHVSLLVMVLTFILSRLKINKYFVFIFNTIFLIFYAFLVNFQVSIMRSVLSYILININKYLELNIKNEYIIILIFSISLLFNPYNIFNLGFQYSYLISFALIKYNDLIKGNYFKKMFIISFLAFIVSLPITIMNNYQINLLTIIFNMIYVPLISLIIFPLSLLCIILPFLDSLFLFIVSMLERMTLLINDLSLIVILKKPSMILIICYFLIIFYFINGLEKQKYYRFIYLIILFLFHYNINYFIENNYVIIFDVEQGDSALIYNDNNAILIDTGGSMYKDYSSDIISFFKSSGIRKIDYLILTHGDYDHIGEAINLVNIFKVEKVIFNCGEFNELEQDLVKVLDKKKISYYSCIKELNIDGNKLYFLNNKDYGNENDNSSVIYTELDGYKFMFMGDASITTEKEILNKYNLPDIDVLKVGHHGSKTSSGKEFISDINPRYSVISVGKNNRYSHPNKEVLDNLAKSKIYRTDEDGSIMFKIKNNKLKIDTCSP